MSPKTQLNRQTSLRCQRKMNYHSLCAFPTVILPCKVKTVFPSYQMAPSNHVFKSDPPHSREGYPHLPWECIWLCPLVLTWSLCVPNHIGGRVPLLQVLQGPLQVPTASWSCHCCLAPVLLCRKARNSESFMISGVSQLLQDNLLPWMRWGRRQTVQATCNKKYKPKRKAAGNLMHKSWTRAY